MYSESPISTDFWLMRFCTNWRIALIGDWFSTKTHEICQFKCQSPLFHKYWFFLVKKHFFLFRNQYLVRLILLNRNVVIFDWKTTNFYKSKSEFSNRTILRIALIETLLTGTHCSFKTLHCLKIFQQRTLQVFRSVSQRLFVLSAESTDECLWTKS